MELTFAIIGCGRIAQRHAEQIAKTGRLTAVCDIVPEKADKLASLYGAKAFYAVEDMLKSDERPAMVSICTPNGLHAFHSILCMEAGINVLCEKPMCIDIAAGEQMIAASGNSGKKLFIVKSARYNPLIMQLKEMIDSGQLGRVFSFQMNCSWNRPTEYYTDSWRGTNSLDGGTLFTQFSHYIDILIWLLGDHKKMSGFRKNLQHKVVIEFEDTGVISLEMQNGAIGSIHYSVNACDKNEEISFSLLTEKVTIKLGGEYMNEILYQQPVVFKEGEKPLNDANDYGFYRGSMSNHAKVYEHVAKALKGEVNQATDGNDALKTVAFIEDFYKNTPVS